MRLFVVPIILVALLAHIPAPVLANNQEAAERIAGAIGTHFPSADVDVAFQGGQVWLRGEAVSQDQRRRIVDLVRNIPGVNVTEVNEEIQVVAPRVSPALPVQAARPPASALTQAPMPVPNAANANQRIANPVANPRVAANAGQPQTQQLPPQPQPQMWTGAMLPAHPQQHFPAAYGVRPGQQQMYPYMPIPYAPMGQLHNMHHHAMPAPAMQQHQMMQQQAMMHHGHHGGPLPGQFNHPHLPDYAWPAYANYPNFAQVSYPRSFAPNAWPYIGPFYPYPQVPLGWRKVTLEHSNGWWWLDFDDGTASGPFSALFRHSMQHRY